jgi:hypothetical protein
MIIAKAAIIREIMFKRLVFPEVCLQKILSPDGSVNDDLWKKAKANASRTE